MVRQFTARRLVENSATMPKKQNTPATAWPRVPIIGCKRYAAPAMPPIAAAIPSRHEIGVRGIAESGSSGGGVTGEAVGSGAGSGVCGVSGVMFSGRRVGTIKDWLGNVEERIPSREPTQGVTITNFAIDYWIFCCHLARLAAACYVCTGVIMRILLRIPCRI